MQPEKINVLNVIVDQHIANCMGVEGHPQAITPNIDRLAAEGVRFTQAYTQNPICTPSRVSVFSGQYCHNHGYYGLCGPAPLSLPSFLSHFKKHGYRTAGIGNLHTPDKPRHWLADHLDLFADSFHTIDGTAFDGTPFFNMIEKAGVLEEEDFYFAKTNSEFAMEGMPSKIPFDISQEGWCVEESIKFMEACDGQPFCMQVALERPHTPCYPSKQFWDMYPEDIELPPTINQDPSGRPPHFQKMFNSWREVDWQGRGLEPKTFTAHAKRLWRGYLACITQVDHALGLLLDYLEETGLAENTIVIYHADHGAYATNFGIFEKAPGICSDSVCRIPFIWCVPGAEKGYVCKQLVENVDIAPTISSLCKLPIMETVDGKDISGMLEGSNESVREIAVTENPWSKALRWGKWRFVHYQPEMFKESTPAQTENQDFGELYNLENDPNETTNLYRDAEYQNIVEECRRLLLEWLIRTTRVCTVWPHQSSQGSDPLDRTYPTVEDGKESNAAGAALRVQKGQLNYI